MKTCPGCGEDFAPKRASQIHCSRACSNRATKTGHFKTPTMRVPSSETDRAYLAAMLDAEGYISSYVGRRGSRYYMVGIVNTDLGLMEWLAGMGGYVRPRRRGPGKQVYDWTLRSSADIYIFLVAVLPYMKIKNGKALDAILDLYGRGSMPKVPRAAGVS